MSDLDFLKGLVGAVSVSGTEAGAIDYLEKCFKDISFETRRNNLGDLVALNYSEGNANIMFDSHIDQIGFVVTEVLEKGFLKVEGVGSPDKRSLEGKRVVVFGEKPIEGVISSIPYHLSKGNELREITELFVDTGLSELTGKVSVGSRVGFSPQVLELGGERVAAAGLDNKISALALYKAAKGLSKTNKKVAFAFSSREEVGLAGAGPLCSLVMPKTAVVVDVSFGFTGAGNKRECGEMGKGAMIGFSPMLDDEFSKSAEEICIKNEIPYQKEIMNSRTGTNADVITKSGSGVKTITISIPLFGMHTALEVVSLSDVEAVSSLLIKMADGEEK